MTIRVGINGFGRIGRNFYRAARPVEDIAVVGVNDSGSIRKIAHLLKYDSVHGRLAAQVEMGDEAITVDGASFAVFSERKPANLRWGDLGVDVVVEATGVFNNRRAASAHLSVGARKVVISAPASCDITVVIGVNDGQYEPASHDVISNASCTTNCLAPMLKVLDESFGVEAGMITTIHAYTGDQAVVDGSHADLRRARAAALNVVPTTTGAAEAIGLVLEELDGRLGGMAMRVPVANGSITDFVGRLGTDVSIEDINAAFYKASAQGPLAQVLDYSDEPLVSSDIVGSPASCTYDAGLTMAHGGLVKVCGWYDNEWGYANRLVDLVGVVGQQ
jgi:glyceraldehyde 3-phosphate dehydrogenase